MANKLVYVGFGFRHHLGGHGGYHQIRNYLGYDYYIDAQPFHDKASKSSQIKLMNWVRTLVLPRFCFGFRAFPYFLIKCLWMAVTKGHLTFHFIYGENLYYDFRLLRVRGCKTVVTLHQPYEWFKDKPSWKRRLQHVDHVILVGETEIALFKTLTGKDNVTFIPHGICADFYCPDVRMQKEKMVLTVGNWLRDFEFADKVYQQLLSDDPEVRIVIVSMPRNKSRITAHERISFLSGISDEELRDLYLKSSCLFLPLTRYTANNALLEAGAVGCNILIACNQPDNSYISTDLLRLMPMKEDTVAQEIKVMLKKGEMSCQLSDFVKKNFSWQRIAEATRNTLLMSK